MNVSGDVVYNNNIIYIQSDESKNVENSNNNFNLRSKNQNNKYGYGNQINQNNEGSNQQLSDT